MKWVLIDYRHINMTNVDEFFWENGALWVFFNGNLEPCEYTDPDRERYRKMCQSQGLRPFEEVREDGL